ncbi:MAG: DegT/DnrJ/EryC1/StrS aminotransferase family protein [Eubacterium sp.]|nr:DegT/DnrJ/EryC1/StrS aminotransferase family protein [Eubacterium sp.]
MTYSEIGSFLWDASYDLKSCREKLWWESDEFNKEYFKSGRNAIKALCEGIGINCKRVLLPIYTCSTVIQPFVDAGWEIKYYGILNDLSIDVGSLEKVYYEFSPSIVFVQSYFGFNTTNKNINLFLKLKNDGAIIVEDITQSLFSLHYIEFADYYVASLRKFLAIPDGGVLISKNALSISGIQHCDKKLVDMAFEAFNHKADYMKSDSATEKERFLKEYSQYCERLALNSELTEISDDSMSIFNFANTDNLAKIRIDNYNYLFENTLHMHTVAPVLTIADKGIVPLYYPIYAAGHRDELQSFLKEHRIYCPVIWPKPEYVDATETEAEYIYNNIICIPIDQRYNVEDMQRIIELLKEYDNE